MAGAEGVQLIQPQGGGGGQEIARPVAAPNFVGMYNEAIKTALEPAKFQYEMYSKNQELQNQLKELGIRSDTLAETSRANRIKEAHDLADMALRTREQTETERAHRADEDYKNNLGLLDQAKEEETERHNQAEENRLKDELEQKKKDQSTMDALRASEKARDDAQTNEIKSKLDDKTNDLKVTSDFMDAIKNFKPGDHYTIDENPQLKQLYEDAIKNLKTPEGKQHFFDVTGANWSLGQELTHYHDMLSWSQDGRDTYIKAYRDYQKAHPNASSEEVFGHAYEDGSRFTENEKVRKGWTGGALTAYQDALAHGKNEAEAMSIGRSAEEQIQAKTKEKAPALTDKIINALDSVIENENPQKEGESDADWQKRIAPLKSQLYRQYGQLPDQNAAAVQPQTPKDKTSSFLTNTLKVNPNITPKPDSTAKPDVTPKPPAVIAKPQAKPTASAGGDGQETTKKEEPVVDPGTTTFSLPLSGGQSGLAQNEDSTWSFYNNYT